jgi:hypothetical protein
MAQTDIIGGDSISATQEKTDQEEADEADYSAAWKSEGGATGP